jgi:uncharacterized protein (DUF427 family)
MKATLKDRVIAESADIVAFDGYSYFPASAVQRELLAKSPKTPADLQCPHGVQFYDVIVDGVRHERAAWSYEAPQVSAKSVAGRFGFWDDVTVG